MSQTPSTFKVIGLVLLATLLGGLLFAQGEKADEAAAESASDIPDAAGDEIQQQAPAATADRAPAPDETPPTGAATTHETSGSKEIPANQANWRRLIGSLTVFVLAIFVGFEVITKVPPTLHTPLMSGSNAISGITLVGAVIVAASVSFHGFVGFIAVALATVNAVGGFMVTHRMLSMFKKR